jgi:CTP synthase (UTP-ammonia lyase)
MTSGAPFHPAHIALLGDYNPGVIAHQGINRSLELLRVNDPAMSWRWCHTSTLAGEPALQLAEFSAIWVVPASPYENPDGVFRAIRYAREARVPFLGTCGGFQHAVIEYARNVLGLEAEHAETASDAPVQLITPLSCSMVEEIGVVRPVPGTRVAALYGPPEGTEGYHCNYGLNPTFVARLEAAGLIVAARDDAGEVRALELASHPFFLLTLFQPERRALKGEVHPLVREFVHAALGRVPVA